LLLYERNVELRVTAGNLQHIFTDLHIEFDIIANRSSKPNQAKISIYNLAAKTRGLFSEQYQAVEFLASYGSMKPVLIFWGTITNLVHAHESVDWKTTIYAGDGQKEFNTIPFSKTYAKGTPLNLVLRDLTTAMGLQANIDLTSVPGKTTYKAFTCEGLAKTCLDQTCESNGLSWSCQNGMIEIQQRDQPTLAGGLAVVLSTDTGMIGSPQITADGVAVTSLLNPAIRPSRLIQIKAMQTINNFGKLMEVKTPNKSANGVYIVDRAHYVGDNFGGKFDVEIESFRP
jgi:hypothetical protein